MEIALNAENIMKPRIKNHDAKEIMEMEMENQFGNGYSGVGNRKRNYVQ
jgi:hypothetical protein